MRETADRRSARSLHTNKRKSGHSSTSEHDQPTKRMRTLTPTRTMADSEQQAEPMSEEDGNTNREKKSVSKETVAEEAEKEKKKKT